MKLTIVVDERNEQEEKQIEKKEPNLQKVFIYRIENRKVIQKKIEI